MTIPFDAQVSFANSGFEVAKHWMQIISTHCGMNDHNRSSQQHTTRILHRKKRLSTETAESLNLLVSHKSKTPIAMLNVTSPNSQDSIPMYCRTRHPDGDDDDALSSKQVRQS
jgi:hypothetical protein